MAEKNTSTLSILHFYWCWSRTFLAGGSWGAGSNSGVATCSFFYFFLSSYFYPSAFYCLFSLLTLLASRDFCENIFLVMLKRNSINLHCTLLIFTGARQKWEPAGRMGDFGHFSTVSLKAHDWSSWILTECSLSWKTVKYCILSEVSMIHSIGSTQMWCIKRIKGWFTDPQICWQDFVK